MRGGREAADAPPLGLGAGGPRRTAAEARECGGRASWAAGGPPALRRDVFPMVGKRWGGGTTFWEKTGGGIGCGEGGNLSVDVVENLADGGGEAKAYSKEK